MAFLLIITCEMQAQRFYYVISVIDIVMYACLTVVMIEYLAKSIDYIFPMIIFAGFSIFASIALAFTFKDHAEKYKISLYYAYIRSFMNCLLFLGSLVAVFIILWTGAKRGFIFYLCIFLMAFELILDFYWTIALRDTIELLNHNHMLQFYPDQVRRESHPYFTDLLVE